MSTEKLLSIIVPVYNVEPFLEDCIRSIERIKTTKEVICINDGSTDNSLSVLKKLAEEFNDISVVDQENAGVSVARNRGISLAKGKYICFFDSDDLVVAEVIDKAVLLLEKNEADCITFGYKTADENMQYREFLCSLTDQINLTVSYDITRVYTKNSAWSTIMRKEIIEKNAISFRNMKYFEDQCFLMDYCACCKKAIVISEAGYLYRTRRSSAMHSKNRSKFWTEDALKAAIHMNQMIEGNADEAFKNYCEKKKTAFVLHVMTMGIMVPEFSAGWIIQELRKNGLYPFPPMWKLLVPNGKSTFINYLRFGFFSKIYYSLFFKATRIVKGVK